MDLIGPQVNPLDGPREPINIHPDVRTRLRNLLFMAEMRGVGYTEFINRAVEKAEGDIANSRRKKRERITRLEEEIAALEREGYTGLNYDKRKNELAELRRQRL